MKLLVETSASFMLVDYGQNQVVEAHRPSVVTQSQFINSRASLGQIKFLGEVTEEATDAEFAKYVNDAEDMELAVSSFLATFGAERPTEKKSVKKRRRKAQEDGEAE